MTKIAWDLVGSKRFEIGVDRGVLYTPYDTVPIGVLDEYPKGFAWNGLKSVESRQEGTATTSIHYDGVKTYDVVYPGDFSASLTAYTYPDEFVPFDGLVEVVEGFFVDNQPRETFGLSFRTLNGNDVSGIEYGYKLHILYNLAAVSDGIATNTVESNVSPIEFKWTLTTTPVEIRGHRPSAHLVLDSNKVDSDKLLIIEDLLYGTEDLDARLPSMNDVLSILVLDVIDNEDGTWSATAPDEILSVSSTGSFTLIAAAASYIDAYSYEIPV